MKKYLAATAMGVAGLLTTIGNANTITLGNSVGFIGPTVWKYDVTFTNSILSNSPPAPAFFTIVDFGPTTSTLNGPTGLATLLPGGHTAWNVTTSLLGQTVPFGLASIGYANNAAALDVTFSYISATPITIATSLLASVTLTSSTSVAPPRPGAYSSQDESSSPPNVASTANGNLLVPIGNAPDGGSTVALFGIALLGVQVLRQKLGAA